MKVILVAGKSGSGKSEVAKYLKEELASKNIKACVTCFSKYLKIFATEVLDWDGSEETKPRDFLQELGMTVRSVRRDFLVYRMIEDIRIYETMVDVVIVSDVRMIEEIERIRELFETIVIRVNRKENNKLNEKQKAHITENALNNYNEYDYVIDNNDDLLLSKVKKIVEERF